jgi:hypothetical protein
LDFDLIWFAVASAIMLSAHGRGQLAGLEARKIF